MDQMEPMNVLNVAEQPEKRDRREKGLGGDGVRGETWWQRFVKRWKGGGEGEGGRVAEQDQERKEMCRT